MRKSKKERTYSPKLIFKELKTVKWPSFKELMANSGLVIIFTMLFGAYFFIRELASGSLVQAIVNLG